jgi:murein L,D-transpeptidase YcbB/YkuD
MPQDVKTVEDSYSNDQLAWLVLRLVAEHAPCTKTSLVGSVSGKDPGSNLAAIAPQSHTQELISNALLKLEARGFIASTQEQISITDAGKRFLDELRVEPSRPRRRNLAHLQTIVPTVLAEYGPRLKRLSTDTSIRVRALTRRGFQIAARARDNARELWERKVAPILGPAATTLVHTLTRLSRAARSRLQGSTVVLGKWRKQSGILLSKAAKASGFPPNAKLAGHNLSVVFGGALLLAALATAGTVVFLSAERGALEAPAMVITPTTGVTPPSGGDRHLDETAAIEPSAIEQRPSDTPNTPPDDAEQTPADPIVGCIRLKLADPAFRTQGNSDSVAALESFYAEREGPPLWMTGAGFSAGAQAIIAEIQHAGDWGLPSEAFDLPPAGNLPATTEAQATDEIKLGLAILKYARFARGGRVSPARLSVLLDQKAALLDPKSILTEIEASAAPDAFLRSLNPKQEQFERLRQALIKARAKSQAQGREPNNEPNIQRLIINMERWRWMPAELGSLYVLNNIPAFTVRVIKDGKSIYEEKTVVGQLKYATPIFTANMSSIVFNPAWTVPETIKLEELQPSLRQGGFLGGPDTSILRDHQLSVSYQGHPVDPDEIDWGRANILQYTFTQPPGPENVLGTLKFNFPNKHAIYMHDTVQPEFFAETARALSHGCIRVRQPDRLAQLLLSEDKGWSAQQVKDLLATGKNSVVALNRPVPVHLAYFTAVVDEQGKVQTFADIYGLDARMGSALFGNAAKFDAPSVTATVGGRQQKHSTWNTAAGGLTEAISGLFGN